MLNIVTGAGPRVGSSFVMRQAKVAGLRIHGDKYLYGALPVAGNPGGYYDLYADEVHKLDYGVAKVWPVSLPLIRQPIDRLVILERRDKDAQMASIVRQSKREKREADPQAVLDFCQERLDDFLACERAPKNIMRVQTEDLNEEISNIITFLGD